MTSGLSPSEAKEEANPRPRTPQKTRISTSTETMPNRSLLITAYPTVGSEIVRRRISNYDRENEVVEVGIPQLRCDPATSRPFDFSPFPRLPLIVRVCVGRHRPFHRAYAGMGG